jgi:hypothetical protein
MNGGTCRRLRCGRLTRKRGKLLLDGPERCNRSAELPPKGRIFGCKTKRAMSSSGQDQCACEATAGRQLILNGSSDRRRARLYRRPQPIRDDSGAGTRPDRRPRPPLRQTLCRGAWQPVGYLSTEAARRVQGVGRLILQAYAQTTTSAGNRSDRPAALEQRLRLDGVCRSSLGVQSGPTPRPVNHVGMFVVLDDLPAVPRWSGRTAVMDWLAQPGISGSVASWARAASAATRVWKTVSHRPGNPAARLTSTHAITPASVPIRRPAAVDPVKVILSTRASARAARIPRGRR